MGERQVAAAVEQLLRQRDRVGAAAVTIDTDKDVLEHLIGLLPEGDLGHIAIVTRAVAAGIRYVPCSIA